MSRRARLAAPGTLHHTIEMMRRTGKALSNARVILIPISCFGENKEQFNSVNKATFPQSTRSVTFVQQSIFTEFR